MRKLLSVLLIVCSGVLFAIAQPLPPDVWHFPLMDGPYCFTGKTTRLEDDASYKEIARTDPAAKYFVLAEIKFMYTKFTTEVPVRKNYPRTPRCEKIDF